MCLAMEAQRPRNNTTRWRASAGTGHMQRFVLDCANRPLVEELRIYSQVKATGDFRGGEGLLEAPFGRSCMHCFLHYAEEQIKEVQTNTLRFQQGCLTSCSRPCVPKSRSKEVAGDSSWRTWLAAPCCSKPAPVVQAWIWKVKHPLLLISVGSVVPVAPSAPGATVGWEGLQRW